MHSSVFPPNDTLKEFYDCSKKYFKYNNILGLRATLYFLNKPPLNTLFFQSGSPFPIPQKHFYKNTRYGYGGIPTPNSHQEGKFSSSKGMSSLPKKSLITHIDYIKLPPLFEPSRLSPDSADSYGGGSYFHYGYCRKIKIKTPLCYSTVSSFICIERIINHYKAFSLPLKIIRCSYFVIKTIRIKVFITMEVWRKPYDNHSVSDCSST